MVNDRPGLRQRLTRALEASPATPEELAAQAIYGLLLLMAAALLALGAYPPEGERLLAGAVILAVVIYLPSLPLSWRWGLRRIFVPYFLLGLVASSLFFAGLSPWLSGAELPFLILAAVGGVLYGTRVGLGCGLLCVLAWALSVRWSPLATVALGDYLIIPPVILLSGAGIGWITDERARAEARLREMSLESARRRTLTQVTFKLSHEMRHPLAVLSNLVFLLRQAGPAQRDRAEDRLRGMERELDRLITHLNALVELIELEAPRPQEVPLPEVLARVLEALPPPEGVRVETGWEEPPPRVRADPEQLQAALRKLVRNAYQAMPEGGRLRVRAEQEGEWVRVRLVDEGSGMDAETLAQAFEPLFSTREFGMGLGLPVARSLVERQGGQLWLESRPGEGTVANLQIPAAPTASAG